ncbi:hypothetical protein RB195_017701 [Necator americanus]|uniref:Uncharacterized protein n=1 Tax=Necator americanus TaxID=51031 RepID=A0ABR1C7Z8_NECAM
MHNISFPCESGFWTGFGLLSLPDGIIEMNPRVVRDSNQLDDESRPGQFMLYNSLQSQGPPARDTFFFSIWAGGTVRELRLFDLAVRIGFSVVAPFDDLITPLLHGENKELK